MKLTFPDEHPLPPLAEKIERKIAAISGCLQDWSRDDDQPEQTLSESPDARTVLESIRKILAEREERRSTNANVEMYKLLKELNDFIKDPGNVVCGCIVRDPNFGKLVQALETMKEIRWHIEERTDSGNKLSVAKKTTTFLDRARLPKCAAAGLLPGLMAVDRCLDKVFPPRTQGHRPEPRGSKAGAPNASGNRTQRPLVESLAFTGEAPDNGLLPDGSEVDIRSPHEGGHRLTNCSAGGPVGGNYPAVCEWGSPGVRCAWLFQGHGARAGESPCRMVRECRGVE